VAHRELRALLGATSIGLGHCARAVALARGLEEELEALYPFFLTGGAGVDFVASNGYDVLPIPPTPEFPGKDGELGDLTRWYGWYALHVVQASGFLRRNVDWSYYDFVVADGELAVAREGVRHGKPTVFVTHELGQRFALRPWERAVEAGTNLLFRRFLKDVDLVLTLDPVADPPPRVHYVGPIARPFSRSREDLRDDFFFRKKIVLVAPGGSAMGGFLIDRAVRAVASLGRRDVQTIFVTGPRVRVPKDLPGFRYGFVPNLQDMVRAADVVVTLAGKTTVAEAQAAGTPVIAIPVRGHAEQERNAARLGYTAEDVDRLPELIAGKLDAPRPPPKEDGRRRAVGLIRALLEDRGLL
jgi:UDP-N-acetylglucosamine--N-acetylmuramyl-(pentapeptide) pyrophosphoryl-undecaprenol N-acetylglucosamine transferase